MKALAAAFAATLLVQPEPWNWADGVGWLDTSAYEESKAICRAVRDREPPAAHRPAAGHGLSAGNCNSGALYYGLGRTPDPEQARLCAFLEAEREQQPGDWPFRGRAMLMTIYANGSGVPRDLDLAIRYACELEAAPAESHGRVLHLAELRGGAAEEAFHYCADVTSGLRGGQCAAFAAEFDDFERARRIEALTVSWPAADKAAFDRLQAALAAFEEAVVEGEVDMTGTLRIAFAVAAQRRLRDDQLRILEHLEAGRPPPYAAAQLGREDARLNAVYRQKMAEWRAEAQWRCCGAPTAEGLRSAQRAWIRYRDAFLDFAAVRYPRLPRDALAAWLTASRADTVGEPVDTGL